VAEEELASLVAVAVVALRALRSMLYGIAVGCVATVGEGVARLKQSSWIVGSGLN
jgi:hypothetical protein